MIALLRSTPALYCLFLGCLISPVMGQGLSELPRAEYYLAKELYGAGRIAGAAEGSRTAFARGRNVGGQRWIDAIPSMVLLGECYYQQGNLASAIEQYDAAVMMALSNPDWIDQIEVGVEQLPELEGIAKGINWFPKTRQTRSAAIPEGIQIAIDPTQLQAGPAGTVVAPVSAVTRLDATEVIRNLSIALIRRWQILGPLAVKSPLSEPAAKLFERQPNQPVEWVRRSWQMLLGCARLSTAADADGVLQLRQGITLGNSFDYFLTARGLLVLAEVEAEQGNFQAAITLAQDASLISAQFGQHAELSESLTLLGSLACASGRIEMYEPLKQAAIWCNKQSLLSQVSALVSASEIAAYGKDHSAGEQLATQVGKILRTRDVTLPRAAARIAYVNAIHALAQNRKALAFSQLETSLKLMHGSAQTGAVVHPVFQAQTVLLLLNDNAITAADAEAMLGDILAEPGRIKWALHPLETIATLTTASLPAFERLVAFAANRQDWPEVAKRMDRLQRQRFFESLPLGGRLLAWRHAIATPPDQLADPTKTIVNQAIQLRPELRTASDQISQAVEKLRNGPLPVNERQLPAEAKRTFTQLSELSGMHENSLMLQALTRNPLPRNAPKSLAGDLQAAVQGDDLLLGFAIVGNGILGVAASSQQVEYWQIADKARVETLVGQLAIEIGLARQPAGKLPSEVLSPQAAWRKTASELASVLIPSQIQAMVAKTQRLLIVPNDRLWYVPFELLPLAADQRTSSWLENRRITYIPTLGSSYFAYQQPRQVTTRVGIVGSFFAIDKDENERLAKSALDTPNTSQLIFLNQKIEVASPVWLRLKTDELCVATQLDHRGGNWDSPLLPLGQAKRAALGSWLDTPMRSPTSIVLPGMQTATGLVPAQDGDDLFLPACAMMLSGAQSAVLSRWPVGGNSGHDIVTRYLEDYSDLGPAKALRRSVLAAWANDYLVADEPALLPAGKEAGVLTSGTHPLLWAGYMCIGDTSP